VRALFYNVKGAGHVNPTLPLARGLVAGGHEVFYTLTQEWRARLEAMGCRYRNTGASEDGPFTTADANPGTPFHQQLLPTTVAVLPHLVEEARSIRPDVVVYDSCAPWGFAVADVLGCPAVCSVSTLLLDEPLCALDDRSRDALAELEALWRVDLRARELGFFYAADNLVYSCEELNPRRESVPGRIHLVGPLFATTDASRDLAEHGLERFADRRGARRVYVSMGTVAGGRSGLAPSFFAPFIDAFAGCDDYEVLVSVGATVPPEALGALPANVTVRQSVPQLAVLQRTDVFVTHGGANSMHEALFHGVPLVCIPHFGDQPANARRVVAAGAGVELPLAELSSARVASDVARVLDEPSHAENARRMGERLRAAGGLARARAVLEELATRPPGRARVAPRA
jgi:MGT family glycosyltransferase